MQIVLMEDDPTMRENVIDLIRRTASGFEIVSIKTEAEFYDFLEHSDDTVRLFVLDVMVPWTLPAPEMLAPPEEVRNQGFTNAGLRCAKRVRDKGMNTPIILYTVLDREEASLTDLFSNTKYIQKSENANEFVEAMKAALQHQ